MIICIYLYIIYISIERKTLYIKKIKKTPLFLNRSAYTKKKKKKNKIHKHKHKKKMMNKYITLLVFSTKAVFVV